MICFHFKVELLLEDIGDDWENLSSSEEEIKRKPRYTQSSLLGRDQEKLQVNPEFSDKKGSIENQSSLCGRSHEKTQVNPEFSARKGSRETPG